MTGSCVQCGTTTYRRPEAKAGQVPRWCPACDYAKRLGWNRARDRLRRQDPEHRAKVAVRTREANRLRRADPEKLQKERDRDRDRKRELAKDPVWQAANLRRMRNQNLRKKFGPDFGIGPYEDLLEKQNGVCAICGDAPTAANLDVDHCHATGKIRGLLCNPCNAGLERFRDRPERLEAAAEYLRVRG